MKIYIPEHVPSRNKGEEAIVQGIYQGLRNQGKDVEILIFSYEPEIDRISYGSQFEVIDGITYRPMHGKNIFLRILETASISLRHFLFFLMWRLVGKASLKIFRGGNWRAYVDSDIILVGHDGVLSDLNILFALFVKGIGKKSTIFGCGFKNFRFKLTEILAPSIITKINLIVLREERSYDYLLSIGIPENKIHLKADPAFLMEPAARNQVKKLLLREGIDKNERPIVGMIALNGTLYSKHFFENVPDEADRYREHVSFFAALTEKIIQTTEGIAIFLPHSLEDIAIARDIKFKMGNNVENVLIIENEYSAAVLKALIQHLDFLISERLHAVIGASTVGTPFFMITAKEDGRAHNIVENTIGRPDLIFNINEPQVNDFLLKFTGKWTEKDKITEYLLDRARLIREECNEAARLLANIV
jgi:polysaccharide pyruvyl transferase WcaK-like protein